MGEPETEHNLRNQDEQRRFYIVGIGASAGGLDPLEVFFKNMPVNSGMAFVVVQHLSPDFKSQMEQLLSRKTRMPIHRVRDGIKIEPDNIYLIPPKKMMVVVNGNLLLTDKAPTGHLSHPIDEFFRSLALDAGRWSIGIVLSGTGADGSKGVVSIADAGGLVLAQDEETAAFDGMPMSAVATGAVTLSLPPDAMPEVLLRYVQGALTPELLREQDLVPEESDLRRIFRLLNDRYKIDFSLYKLSTVGRRIKRRLLLTNNHDLQNYWKRIENDEDELENLYKDLLIGVTRFFRDTEMFNVLESQVIPRLIANFEEDRPLRIWVAGCATGEEPYSIAILFHELLQAAGKPFNVKIFATDVHQASIKAASAGVYTEDALQGVSEKRRQRYFTEFKNGFLVNQEIRKVVSFATHNIITDAPFTKMDFISCRNLLIYFQSNIQKKVISIFHFSLRTGGILTLGSSETVGDLAGEFEEVNSRHRIYRKKRDVRLPAESRFDLNTTLLMPSPVAKSGLGAESYNSREKSLLAVYDNLLNQYMPPAFLLDEKLHIVHIFGGGEKYLRLRSGRTSTYFLDLIEEEVKTSFAGAINHVVQKDAAVNYTGIKMRDSEGNVRSHQVSVQPIYEQRAKANYFFVKLTEQKITEDSFATESVHMDAVTRDHIESLEAELRFSQENLQATIEELETANEEMQASNEELVASNEELQSTNEELQSVNEELYTVNHEYQKKINELVEANDDMDNLLATTRVGVIFLDRELCIRRYTPEISRIFHLLPQDIGRAIAGFTHTLQYAGLVEQLRKVIETGDEFETETQDQNGHPFILRILPYRAAVSGESQGVLLTLIDIGSLKAAQAEVARFKVISDLTSDGNALVAPDGKLAYVNAALCALLQYEAETLLEHNLADLVEGMNKNEFDLLFERARVTPQVPFECRLIRRDKSLLTVEVNLTSVSFGEKESLLFFSARDITQRIVTQNELRLRTRALESTRNGILITEGSGEYTIIYANKGFTDITGYAPEEILGRNCRFLQGEETTEADVQQMRKAIRSGEPVRVCLLNYKKSGEPFWNDLQISPVFADDGKVRNFIGVINDVTQHRAAEQKSREDARKIRLLINSTEEGIWFINREEVCVFCNVSAAQLLGYSSPAELLGRDLHQMIHHTRMDGSPYPKEECTIVHSIATGETCSSDEEIFWKKDGTRLPVEYWSHPIREESGEINGSVVTFIDITQRKRHQQKLRDMQEHAEQANKTKTVFLANISHELRTPLTAILGFAELLQMEIDSASAREKLDILRRNSLHLLDLLNDLLDLSKIESGFLQIDLEECDLLNLLRDVQAVGANRASEKGLLLTFEVLNEVPAIVVTDPIRYRQIVTNLLSNAIKYTEKGSVRVTVRTVSSGDGESIELAVTDTGRGIIPSERENLFKPFVRGTDNLTRKTPGSGLGLSISQQLARQMGGEITFDSTPGLGSQFRFTLPLRKPPGTAKVEPGVIGRRGKSEPAGPVPELACRVLIADDHEDIRQYLVDILRPTRAIVTTVNNGQEAVDYILKHRDDQEMPDLILMDFHMPVMNGQEAVAAVRSHGIDIPIIAITAGAMKGERERCLLAGFNDYLSKPFDVKLLLEKISRIMRKAGCTYDSQGFDAAREGGEKTVKRLLVVDDNVDVTLAVKELLQSWGGFEVETVFDGQTAVEKVNSFRPDAVLLDIQLPDINGFEVVRRLTNGHHPVPPPAFIAMTGYADPQEKQRALRSGFSEYLVKPFTLTEMINALEAVFRKESDAQD